MEVLKELVATPGRRLLVLCVLVLVMAFVNRATGGSRNDARSDRGPTDSGAIVWCREAVSLSLKAPATADFAPTYETMVSHESAMRYRVTAYVDAENSFGAKLRHNFGCVAEYQGDDKWRIVDLDIVER